MSDIAKEMLSSSKFYMGYSRWIDEEGRYESWEDSVHRVMDMHREKYKDKMSPELDALIKFAEHSYAGQKILGAQRALQFGGEQVFKHEARMYNCSSSHTDRIEFFQEAMYLLLCGCGVGFSVQKQHIEKLPNIHKPYTDMVKVFTIPDSIEGWADAFGVLLQSYTGEGKHSEYNNHIVHFDYSLIRPRGSEISGGFKAPGPDGLRDALTKCTELLDNNQGVFKSLTAYDFTMHMSDAVLSGGVRRSATICMFSPDDEDMMTAKVGNWFIDNPQRGRSNNSVVLKRGSVGRQQFADIMKSVKDYGEPGFIFVEDEDFTVNPCVEIGMLPRTESGVSGFQFCNLTEINGGAINSLDDFMQACIASAIMGTLQAGYTNFTYVSDATREITEREALLGCSITGWMNSPDVLFDPDNMELGAKKILAINKIVAEMIGINPAARATCVKPSGNASVLLGTGSGIHGEHSEDYFRNVQMTSDDDVAILIGNLNPNMVEDSVWSAGGTDVVVSFPVSSKEGSIYKSDLLGVKQLEYVKLAQQHWVESGTDVSLCVDDRLRHNVSNTITVDDWDAVEDYIYENQNFFAGISLLAASGDKAYPQAPFTEVLTRTKIIDKYGDAGMFASGLIVDGLHAFNNNLWTATSTVLGFGEDISEQNAVNALKIDWVRRAIKFAENHFGGELQMMDECLKDVFNYHKWSKITDKLYAIDFKEELDSKTFVDIDSIGAQACSGGGCETSF
jgi:ribonucleoside-triphosphate reductase